jgi:Na+/proline symporter
MAGVIAFKMLPENVSFSDSVSMAGELGKLNLVSFEFNPDDRYNVWSGLLAGTFLFLSYFGTDQSQVARYLGGKSLTESRMGLIFNGLLKIPMQFLILFIGVMVFIFYLFHKPPVYYNQQLKDRAMAVSAPALTALEGEYDKLYAEKSEAIEQLVEGIHNRDEKLIDEAKDQYQAIYLQERNVRDSVKKVIAKNIPGAKTQDTDYIFLNFVMNNLPNGVVGLLLAVMFSAAMSSMASELNALASTTTVDIYKRSVRKDGDAAHYLRASRGFTIMWALLAMVFAILANFAENLIQFVNIVGSLFYGTILGIFITAFYLKRVQGNAVFFAALIAEAFVLYCYFFTEMAYLWYNIIGCTLVAALSLFFELIAGKQNNTQK